jgi:hypothetical protein
VLEALQSNHHEFMVRTGLVSWFLRVSYVSYMSCLSLHVFVLISCSDWYSDIFIHIYISTVLILVSSNSTSYCLLSVFWIRRTDVKFYDSFTIHKCIEITTHNL